MFTYQLIEKFGALGQVWPDAESTRAALERLPTMEERFSWRKLVHKTFDREALRAGFAIFGRDLTLEDLGRLEPFASQYVSRVRENMSIAPMLAPFVKLGGPPPADISGVRRGVLARGLTVQGWKWLCRQRPGVVRKLLAFGWTPESIFWTNVLSKARAAELLSANWLEAGRPYLMGQHYEHREAVGHDSVQHALVLERFLRVLPPAPGLEDLPAYVAIVTALHVNSLDSKWQLQVQRNSTWKGLANQARRLEAARMALAAEVRAGKEGADVTWRPVFGDCETEGVQIRELTSNLELRQEGVVQNHCVGDGPYLEGCLTGQHIIASLALPATRQRATLQLRRLPAGRGFVIGQLAGAGNSRVPQTFWRAARALQARLSS